MTTSPEPPGPDRAGTVAGFDHIALPMQETEAMAAFYRSLGLPVTETPYLVQVRLGTQMINFHRPEMWHRPDFALRAPAATPPCGDICLVWEGSAESLQRMLDEAAVTVIEGPVERQGGRNRAASSVYVRDPDGNLVEFMRYPDAPGP